MAEANKVMIDGPQYCAILAHLLTKLPSFLPLFGKQSNVTALNHALLCLAFFTRVVYTIGIWTH